jgi:hypothetical protein
VLPPHLLPIVLVVLGLVLTLGIGADPGDARLFASIRVYAGLGLILLALWWAN